MEITAYIINRQDYSPLKILTMRIIRYLQTGYLLHLISIFSVFMVFWLGNLFGREFTLKTFSLRLFLSGYGSGYFFTLIFFSQLDARSRFQNYKLTKDKLYEYGFDIRLLRPFVYSRCQRDAIAVAAREMNFGNEWKKLNHQLGFKWYHLLPHLVIKHPKILLTKDYWDKTLFVKPYHSKYFLW